MIVRALAAVLCAAFAAPAAVADPVFRSFDGSGNNLANPTWGMAGTALIRLGPDSYADGAGGMPGGPNPRAISNAVVAQPASMPSTINVSNMFWQWGQFIDHDLDLVPTNPAAPAMIAVPAGDPQFDPGNTGAQVIPFTRSVFDPATGTGAGDPRQQINTLTSYIDASMVYGSNAASALSLRTLSGGKLSMSAEEMPPVLADGNFVAGDIRINEQLGLLSMHALFVREHNMWADQIAAADPGLSDEEIFQRARRYVGAEIQAITYNEFLPILLGGSGVGSYGGYDAGVNATVSNEFAAAGFRLGHTMLPPEMARLNEDGSSIPQGPIALQDTFLNPGLIADGGIESILRGLAATKAQEFDSMLVDDVRNFLFVAVPSGLDLAAVNIQRGRDHGLPSYNDLREALGLPRIGDFFEPGVFLPDAAARLASIYTSVDDIDLWVGALSEIHLPGAMVGPLLHALLTDQFSRARDGDRFWYESLDMFSDDEIEAIEARSLAQIILDNTWIDTIQANVFFAEARVAEPAALLLFAFGLTAAAAGRRVRRA
ncbi:MAG: peroxidase family protein [Rhodospirillaceae bacterium]